MSSAAASGSAAAAWPAPPVINESILCTLALSDARHDFTATYANKVAVNTLPDTAPCINSIDKVKEEDEFLADIGIIKNREGRMIIGPEYGNYFHEHIKFF